MDYIPSFIARKHGIEPISYDIPVMEKYLQETYGITVYQEQVMLLSRLLANFTRGESDMLRKAMGKKQIDKMAKLKVKFMKQGQENGHEEKVLEKIWADWEKFASYAFNKSHATCYSWVAYQTAYLKANYPAEYMAGVLSRNLTMSDKLKKIMDECRRMGIDVKGPDVNESLEKFGVNKAGSIRFGLGAVKGVGLSAVSAIIKERRENGPFTDIYDFVERVNLSACNRAAIENLAMAGALDCFGIPREAYVEKVTDASWSDQLVKYGQTIQNDRNSLQTSLFGELEPIETNRPTVPDFIPWPRLRLLEEEKKMVTIYISAHPLDPYYMELTYGTNCTTETLKENTVAGADLTLGGLVTAFDTKIARSGSEYGVLEVEDFSGKTSIRLFGQSYKSMKGRLTAGDAVLLKIKAVPSRFNPQETDTVIEDVVDLDRMKGTVANAVTIYLDSRFKDEKFFKELHSFKGDDVRRGDLYLDVIDTESRQDIRLHSRHRYNVSKEMVKFLEGWGVKFRIHTV